MSTTSKHRLKLMKKHLQDAEDTYKLRRTEALNLRMRALMSPVQRLHNYPVKPLRIARENACSLAAEAKHWVFHLRKCLDAEMKKEVVPHGGRWSQAAIERNSK